MDGILASDTTQRIVVPIVDGRLLDVLVSGPAKAPAVIIHLGTPTGLVPMPAPLDPVSLGVRMVMYARPGYCRSTPHPGRTVADAASDTGAILDALDIDTFVNLGWSGGGPHALACSALLAGRCTATAVVAGFSPFPNDVWPPDAFKLTRQGGDVLELASQTARAWAATAEAKDMAAMATNEPDRARLRGEFAEWMAALTRSAWEGGTAGLLDDNEAFVKDWGFDLADTWHVSIWHGIEDDVVPAAHGEWLAANIVGSDLHLVSDEGHVSIALRFPEIIDDLVAHS